MEPVKQNSIEMKECVVQLERLNMDIYDDSSDSLDIPFAFSSNRKKTKSKKSSAELLKEHQNLAQNLKVDNESVVSIEETIRRLETVEIENVEDRSSETPDSIPCEENDVQVFCVKDSLQFFNSRDVTPAQCGYENRCHDSFPVCVYEKEMLSFKRVEFEYVISSFLFSAKECCISDFKSFVTFLLRTLSVHSDTTFIIACYRTLVSLLNSHPDSSCLNFSSAEVFMLLFNYGIDVDSFKFFSKWTDVKKKLEAPQYQGKNFSVIPVKWLFNLKFILKAFIKIISVCTFKDKEMEKIIIFFMWMSTDSSLLKENLYTTVQDCIYVCLENFKEEKWNKCQCNIVNDLIFMETSSEHERWTNVSLMTESIPNRGKRGIQLCKQISFFALKCLCLGSNQNLDEDCLGFHINELQFLIKQLVQIDCNLLKYAAKFVDNCVKHLDASKEEYKELCNLLKHCEASFSETALNEKTLFLKIYAKARTFCGQKILLHERSNMFNLINPNLKSEKNEEPSDSDYRNSPCYSEISGKDQNSFTPVLSEDSQSCSTNQSDHISSLSSKENSIDVPIKVEYTDESCDPEIVKNESSLKILIRKKRSSRSSSGNSLVDPKLINNDLKCEDDLSKESSEFECHLLNDGSGARNAVLHNKDVDLPVPGPSIAISDFSVEYSEKTRCPIKMEAEEYCDQGPISSQVKKVNVVDNENLGNESLFTSENYINPNLFMGNQVQESDARSAIVQNRVVNLAIPEHNIVISEFSVEYPEETCCSIKMEAEQNCDHIPTPSQVGKMNNDNLELLSISENYVNQNLFMDDQSPLLEICEVKSIAPSNMDNREQSSAFLSDLLYESTNITNTSKKNEHPSTPLEVPVTEDNVVLSNYEMPMLCNEPEIIAYEGGILRTSVKPDTNLCLSSVVKAISSPLQENNGTTTLKQSTSSTPPIHKDDLLDVDEDILIIKETVSPKKLSKLDKKENILPLPVQKYSEILSEISITPVKNVPSSNDLANNEEVIIIDEKTPPKNNPDVIFLKKVSTPTQIKTNLSSEIKPQKNSESESNKTEVIEKVSTDLNTVPQENSSDNDEIVLVDVVVKNYEEATSTKAKSSKLMDNHIVNPDNKTIKFSQLKSESHNLQCQEVLNSVLKEIDIKKDTFDSQCNEAVNSILESIDASTKEHVDDNSIVLNSCVVDSNKEHLVLSDRNSTKKSVLKGENDLIIGLSSNTSTVEANLEVGCKNLDESNAAVTFFRKIEENIRRLREKVFNDKSFPGTSGYLNPIDISNINESHNVDNDKSDKFSSRTCVSSLMDEICADTENRTIDVPPSSSHFTNDLQDNINNIGSDVSNIPLKYTESIHKTAENNVLDIDGYPNMLVKSPVAVNESVFESDNAKQTCISEIGASQNIITDFAYSVSEMSDSNILDDEIENQSVNKLTMAVSNNDANCSVPLVKSSDDSILQNNDKNKSVSWANTKHFTNSCNGNILSVSNLNKIVSGSRTKIFLDALIKSGNAKKTFSNHKRTSGSVISVAKKSCKNGHKINNFSSKVAEDTALHTSSTFSYTSPSSKIQRKRKWSENKGDITANRSRKCHRKYSPIKSPLSAKYSSPKSPKSFFDYAHTMERYKNFNRASMLSKTGLNLTNVLRAKIAPNSSCNQENSTLETDDDSDVVELYTDPKRYADKDCLVIFESSEIVILDSD